VSLLRFRAPSAHFKATVINRSNIYQSATHKKLAGKKCSKIDEDDRGEFIGIINYSLMALIQLELGIADQPDLNVEKRLLCTIQKLKLPKI
jgi:hypothetical protein